MRTLVGVPLLALVAGCATASLPGAGDDDIVVPVDARESDGRPVDARVVDAPPPVDAPPAQQTITLTQTSDENPLTGTSIACSNQTTGFTRDNSYYRVFPLTSFGVNRPFTAQRVTFKVEQATASAGSQTVQVKLYTLSGGVLSLAALTPIAGNNVIVPNGALTTINVPIAPAPVVPAGATLVVEVFSPDGDTVGNAFFIGTNSGTETASGYLRSTTCMVNEPTTYAALGFGTTRLILTVTGTY